jgi:hypothetical protein
MAVTGAYVKQGQENVAAFLQGVRDERNASFRRLATADLAIAVGLAAGPVWRHFKKEQRKR